MIIASKFGSRASFQITLGWGKFAEKRKSITMGDCNMNSLTTLNSLSVIPVLN